MHPHLYDIWEYAQIHSSNFDNSFYVSVIDFHGLEDRVIPYDITSAKGNTIEL